MEKGGVMGDNGCESVSAFASKAEWGYDYIRGRYPVGVVSRKARPTFQFWYRSEGGPDGKGEPRKKGGDT